jgi:nuclear cap-binding protein subunit 1
MVIKGTISMRSEYQVHSRYMFNPWRLEANEVYCISERDLVIKVETNAIEEDLDDLINIRCCKISASMSYSKRRSEGVFNPYHKRSRGEFEKSDPMTPETALGSLVFILGDKTNDSLVNNIKELSRIILEDYEKYKTFILETILNCISEMAGKVSIYSALIHSICMKRRCILDDILTAINNRLLLYVQNDKWYEFSLLFRFIGELVNTRLISAKSWIDYIQPFLNQPPSISMTSSQGEFFIWCILSTLWLVGSILSKECIDELKDIFKRISEFIEERRRKISSIIESPEFNSLNNDRLDNLYGIVYQMYVSSKWNNEILIRPEISINNEFEIPNIPLLNASIDSFHSFPNVGYSLRLYMNNEPDDIPLPDVDSIDRWILYEMVSKLVHFGEKNRYRCAEYLLSIELNSSVDMGSIIVETILSELLTCSLPKHRPIYYSSLIICLVRTSPRISKSLNRAIHSLFYTIHELDHVQLTTFSEWFSHYLTNFEFVWDWSSWQKSLKRAFEDDLANTTETSIIDISNPNLTIDFLRNLFSRLARLSYHQNILKMIPDYFHKWFPDPPEPYISYMDIKSPQFQPFETLFKELCNGFQSRMSNDQIEEILSKFPSDLDSETTKLAHEMFIQGLLLIGSKSLTHSRSIMDRYITILRRYNTNINQQYNTIDIVQEVWQKSPQMVAITLLQLFDIRIVPPELIISQLFKYGCHKMSIQDFWDTINSIVERMSCESSEICLEFFESFSKHLTEIIKSDSNPLKASAISYSRHLTLCCSEIHKLDISFNEH